MEDEKIFNVALRIPGWCSKASVVINGFPYDISNNVKDGYAVLNRSWRNGDCIELNLDLTPKFMEANPKVRADAGKVAIQRGPLVYCLEEVDNDKNLNAISVDTSLNLTEEFDSSLLGGAVMIKAHGIRIGESDWGGDLYRPLEDGKAEEVELKAVPYYLWGNRLEGEMLVWIRYLKINNKSK